MAAQASLSKTWSETLKTGFLVSRLIFDQLKFQLVLATFSITHWTTGYNEADLISTRLLTGFSIYLQQSICSCTLDFSVSLIKRKTSHQNQFIAVFCAAKIVKTTLTVESWIKSACAVLLEINRKFSFV